MRKGKKIIIVCCVIMMLSVSVPVAASGFDLYDLSGTERFFNVDLPNYYQNYAFQYRQKENGTPLGYVYLVSKSSHCDGIAAWFENGNGSIITNLKEIRILQDKHYIIYSSGSSQGSQVRLVVEDLNNTYIGHHNVTGYVNYN